MKKKILFIILYIIMLNVLSVFVGESNANTNEYKRIVTEQSWLSNIVKQEDYEIEKDGEIYEYVSITEEKIDTEKKIIEQITEEKELTQISEEYLEEQFEKNIQYEDEKYKGNLELIDYNIQTIDNGYSERIDSKEIKLSNMTTNDLMQVEKSKNINGREYVLINVVWDSEEDQEIDNTLVPKIYKGTAIYQCVIRTNNPNTYKVSANYKGEVGSKVQLSNYIITYQLKEHEKDNNIVKNILFIAGGIIVIGLFIFTIKPNATIYNVQDGKKLIKLKSVKLKDNKIIDITDKKDKIFGNSFILKLKYTDLKKYLNSTVIIKLNSQNKHLIITSENNHFNF